MGSDREAAASRSARLPVVASIVGGLLLMAVSLAFLVPALVGLLSASGAGRGTPTPGPDDPAFMESSVQQALVLLEEYGRSSDPDVAADLEQIAAVISDQARLIEDLAASSAPAPTAGDGLTITIAISGAITGAVAAAAGVVSAVGAVRRRRPESIRVLGT
jgi:hypothetical protein